MLSAALVAATGAVLVAPRGGRLKALLLNGIAVSAAMAVLTVALLVVRALYLDDLSTEVVSPEAARAVVDAFAGPLRTALVLVFLGGVAVAAVARGAQLSALSSRRAR